MRQVAARVKHPCFGVRVASVHKINRLHLENVACRGEKLLFEKTVFKTFCGEKDDKYMKTPHFRAVFSVLHLSSTHFGPSSAARTHGLLVPNLSGILFPLVYSGFQPFSICFTYSLTLLYPLFPSVPEPYVVIYVVKNASRPVSGECSPVPDGKRFVFQTVCIVTLSRRLCKLFLSRGRLKG